MSSRPTYEELEQRVQTLERQVADRNQAGEAFREREGFAWSLLVNFPNPIIVINPDTSVRYVNQSMERLTGFSFAELVGRKAPYPWWPEETHQKASSDLEKAMQYGARGLEELCRKKNGDRFWVETNLILEGSHVGINYYVANWVDVTHRKQAAETLRKSQEKLGMVVASVPDHMSMIDNEYNIVWANDMAVELFGPDLVGKKCYNCYYGSDKPYEPCIGKACFKDGKVHEQEKLVTTRNGQKRILWSVASPAAWYRDGRPKFVLEITRRKHTEENLQKALDEMEQRIETHTAELSRTAERLRVELTERKRAETALKEREAALHAQANELQEANEALRVVVKRMDEDKKTLENKVSLNVKRLAAPYAEKLKKSGLDAKQMAYLNMLESHLNDVISPFAHKLSSKYSGLTPAEIQTAFLVKDGKSSKEIAELSGLSIRTVECHRGNIRRKIGVKNKKVSLRTQLLFFE
ncbi:MAG TPA: PAS domain S-box protein [Desulfobacterales bacterium]|nr:PAS domain S-box protein [Desulfobacterales bacterium]